MFQQTQWVGAKQVLRRIGRPRLLTQSWPSHRSRGDLSSWPRGIWFKLRRRKAEIGWCETHIVSGFFGVMVVSCCSLMIPSGYPVACLEGNWISFAIRFNKHFQIRKHQGRTGVMRYDICHFPRSSWNSSWEPSTWSPNYQTHFETSHTIAGDLVLQKNDGCKQSFVSITWCSQGPNNTTCRPVGAIQTS